MLGQLHHRGPDDAGAWIDESGLALGHTRLSILDLSEAGHQPMASISGRYVITYNGEIYNFQALRKELEKSSHPPVWRGHSDTEVLLAAIEAWGVKSTLRRCNGMFAFALWDRHERKLMLTRDRMGEKPLYFGRVGAHFAFASELNAFACLNGWSPRMHNAAIRDFLGMGYVRGPQSAIEGVFRLPPASLLTLGEDDLNCLSSWDDFAARLTHYWSVDAAHDTSDFSAATEQALVESVHDVLSEAVALRMVADVPVGAFLSGGIDSSLIVALMQENARRPVHTFSIGFNSARHNEAQYALAVARHLGTTHTELYLDAHDALELVPTLATTSGEPFADYSQIPTMLVSKLARESVTVALSGDGGDELFGGYGRYFAMLRLWRTVGVLPQWVRKGLAGTLVGTASLMRASSSRENALPERLRRFAHRLAANDIDAMRAAFICAYGAPDIQRAAWAPALGHCKAPTSIENPLRRMLYGDQLDYLPDDILCKVDRASMAYSLETRIPLLDHRVVELASRFANRSLIAGSRGKLPLRQLLERHVPASLIERPKQGFAPPLGEWLRGPLKEWAEELLSPASLAELPMLDVEMACKLWRAHLGRRVNAEQVLWNILTLSDWRIRFGVSH
jgi:asparagine synthase (glutamine-hydrolysing)